MVVEDGESASMAPTARGRRVLLLMSVTPRCGLGTRGGDGESGTDPEAAAGPEAGPVTAGRTTNTRAPLTLALALAGTGAVTVRGADAGVCRPLPTMTPAAGDVTDDDEGEGEGDGEGETRTRPCGKVGDRSDGRTGLRACTKGGEDRANTESRADKDTGPAGGTIEPTWETVVDPVGFAGMAAT